MTQSFNKAHVVYFDHPKAGRTTFFQPFLLILNLFLPFFGMDMIHFFNKEQSHWFFSIKLLNTGIEYQRSRWYLFWSHLLTPFNDSSFSHCWRQWRHIDQCAWSWTSSGLGWLSIFCGRCTCSTGINSPWWSRSCHIGPIFALLGYDSYESTNLFKKIEINN